MCYILNLDNLFLKQIIFFIFFFFTQVHNTFIMIIVLLYYKDYCFYNIICS